MANQSSHGAAHSFLEVEVPSKNDKARWVAAAQRAKLTLPQWVNERLNLAARREMPDWNQSRPGTNQK